MSIDIERVIENLKLVKQYDLDLSDAVETLEQIAEYGFYRGFDSKGIYVQKERKTKALDKARKPLPKPPKEQKQ